MSNTPKPFKNTEKRLSDRTKANKKASSQTIKKDRKPSSYGIPKPVANRMARRLAITTGLPTISGMSVFIISYIFVAKGIAEIPPGVTLISSAVCFLAGLFGLSYGILSASWEENPGSILGLENIRPNIYRMRMAFKSVEKEKK